MPTLHWIGKEKVVNHHRDVPFKVLEHQYGFDEKGKHRVATNSGNKIIHGDNLEALKSLLPEYEEKVKCIYIDPPYNTGNENWIYNDNVNDPKIQKWLEKVVGKEGDDLSRHDKWLCMLYPRLSLLYKLLSDDGVIFVSIDDNALVHLGPLLNEVFGAFNFVTNVIWEKADSPRNSARQFSTDHDYILVYSKRPDWTPHKLPRTEEANSIYQNPDDDERGPWIPGDPFANKPYSKGLYELTGPTGRKFSPPAGRFWRISKNRFNELEEDGRIWWGPNKSARPSIKRYLNEVSDLVPRTLWKKNEVGSNRTSKNEMRMIFPDTESFDTPKPVALLERILTIGSGKSDIILDSFAGSATTAHAVLNLNKRDGGKRKFILVEMEDYCESLTNTRVQRVIKGFDYTGNDSSILFSKKLTLNVLINGTEIVKEIDKLKSEFEEQFDGFSVKFENNEVALYGELRKLSKFPGTGGSFDYYELGEPLFDKDQNLNEAVGLPKIRQYIWYSETRDAFIEPEVSEENEHFLGEKESTAYYFYYKQDNLTTLDYDFLPRVKTKAGQYVIYADNCLLPKAFMSKHNIVFKKIPRDITRF